MSQNADKIAVVTVHGTGDTAHGPDGEKWFQRGSKFTDDVKRRLAEQGVEADIVPHLWSGANSAWERERGANKLAARIRKLFHRYAGVHVIGHSHGGNVANDAAVLLKWGLRGGRKNERLDSLTTVGTPFFNVRTGFLQMLAGVVFLVVAWGSALAFPITALVSLYYVLTTHEQQAGMFVAWLAYVLLVGPCVWFMLNMSRQGIRRVLRPRTGGRTQESIFAIWHENDEAISFLQRVEELPVEAFPRGSLFRGSRSAAISWGVLAVIVLCLANPVIYSLNLGDYFHINYDIDPLTGQIEKANAGNIIAVTILGLLFAPVFFFLAYAFYRFIVGGVSEFGARPPMNRFVGGVLRGVAYGRDGDQELFGVSTTSHTHNTVTHVLTGDVAARMQTRANAAADKLIDKYRWALFSVGGDSSGSLTTLTTDAMTWDSLIHTTYFDQPETAEVVANYIAAQVKGGAYSAGAQTPHGALAHVDPRPAAEPPAAPARNALPRSFGVHEVVPRSLVIVGILVATFLGVAAGFFGSPYLRTQTDDLAGIARAVGLGALAIAAWTTLLQRKKHK